MVPDGSGRFVWGGVAVYYGVLGFNLAMTIWIDEALLAVIGAAIHVVVASIVWSLYRKPRAALGPEHREIQRA
jgi:hypothetical protein